MPTFPFTVDDEPQSTTEHMLTPVQILQNAGLDPATHYLIELIGHEQRSYQATPAEPIHMHQKMRFISVSTGPTTVSSAR